MAIRDFKAISGSILASCVLCVSFVATSKAADHGDPILVIDEGAAAVILIEPLATTQELLWSGRPLVAPTDAVLEEDGTVLIVDPGADAVFRFDLVGGVSPELFIPSGVDDCWNLRLNDDELLLSGPGGLSRANVATGGQTPLPTDVVDPRDVDFLPSGDVLVADPGAGELISVDPATWEGTSFAPGSTSSWIDVDPDGQVVAVGPDGVFLVDAAGGDPTLLASGGFLFDPSAVAFGGHGDIYVADRGPAGGGAGAASGPAVVKVHPVTGAQTVVASGGFLQAPSALVVLEVAASELPALPALGRGALAVLLLLVGLTWAIWRSRRSASAGA